MTAKNIQSLCQLIGGIALITLAAGCQSYGPNTTAGGVFGGTTGGLLGAAIGAHEGKTTEGALLGAAAGAAAGSLLGNQVDRQEAAFQQQQAEQLQLARQSAVTLDQILQMSNSGLSDEVIVNQIHAKGVAFQPTTNDLILMKNNRVSDRVIGAIQSSPPIGSAQNWRRREPTAIQVVEPAVVVEPCPVFVPGPRFIPHPYRHCRPRARKSHFSFSYGF